MRSVNANLLEINQAKSRINQAKKEGKTNVDLNAPTTPVIRLAVLPLAVVQALLKAAPAISNIEKKKTKCVSFSDFICTFAMSYKNQ